MTPTITPTTLPMPPTVRDRQIDHALAAIARPLSCKPSSKPPKRELDTLTAFDDNSLKWESVSGEDYALLLAPVVPGELLEVISCDCPARVRCRHIRTLEAVEAPEIASVRLVGGSQSACGTLLLLTWGVDGRGTFTKKYRAGLPVSGVVL